MLTAWSFHSRQARPVPTQHNQAAVRFTVQSHIKKHSSLSLVTTYYWISTITKLSKFLHLQAQNSHINIVKQNSKQLLSLVASDQRSPQAETPKIMGVSDVYRYARVCHVEVSMSHGSKRNSCGKKVSLASLGLSDWVRSPVQKVKHSSSHVSTYLPGLTRYF